MQPRTSKGPGRFWTRWWIVKNVRVSYPQFFYSNNRDISDPIEIANRFCDYFTGPNLAKQIPISVTTAGSYLHGNFPNSFFFSLCFRVGSYWNSEIASFKLCSRSWQNLCVDYEKKTQLILFLNQSVISLISLLKPVLFLIKWRLHI